MVWRLSFALLLVGCAQTGAFDANGFRCAADSDCDATTFCFQNRCRLLLDRTAKPGPLNTGVPQLPGGATLTPMSGGVLDQAGQVVDMKDIQGCLQIKASNITIRRSRIRCGEFWIVSNWDGATGLLLEDVEIDGLGFSEAVALAGGNATLRRANIHSVYIAVRATMSNITLESSYIHDLKGTGAAIGGEAVKHLAVKGNTLEGPASAGQAIVFDGAASDLRIEQNWLSGGAITVQFRGVGAFDVQLNDNRFGRNFVNKVWDLTSGVTHVGNVFDDNNEPVP